ncbi:MAG: imidazole glycerol phosphate synthase subunit HisH [Spirochaetaceae bacterium]|nr:imidazole glycerol phosphate synthase subunit HisH [Spirochaetaceae bacterium]
MMRENDGKRLFIVVTGTANLASICALCRRAGVEPVITSNPDALYGADYALLPGVGAFGAALSTLRKTGMDGALAGRVAEGRPTMGICLGMQMLCAASEESPGAQGLGLVPLCVEKFKTAMPLPQLGWNRVEPQDPDGFIKSGWAYFANSYRITVIPEGFGGAFATNGEKFVAALEFGHGYGSPRGYRGRNAPSLLLCQFHPELSGAWGLDLFSRWMGLCGQGRQS